MKGKTPGPGCQVEISDSIELCIVELTRVDCIYIYIYIYIYICVCVCVCFRFMR